MNLWNYIIRPEYVFRPKQFFKRIAKANKKEISAFEIVELPWDLKVKVNPNEAIGRSIFNLGIYDLVTTEAIYRLVDDGEIVLDIGANIGYYTGLMSKKVGKTGKVLAFEPQCEIFQKLKENICMCEKKLGYQNVNLYNIALSDLNGRGLMHSPLDFEVNSGQAFILSDEASKNVKNINENNTFTVQLACLDAYVNDYHKIGLLKIDVEGYELKVFEGGINTIKKQIIRDIIFEEHNLYPSPTTNLLEKHGYKIFGLQKGFLKPLLNKPQALQKHLWEPPNYIATIDPLRLNKHFKKMGWLCFEGN